MRGRRAHEGRGVDGQRRNADDASEARFAIRVSSSLQAQASGGKKKNAGDSLISFPAFSLEIRESWDSEKGRAVPREFRTGRAPGADDVP